MESTMKLLEGFYGAEFVQINGELFETEYLRVPDESSVPDDIVLEAKSGDTELSFTNEELNDAQYMGEGVYRLKSGIHLRFLNPTTIH